MTKKLILIVIVILGYTILNWNNESGAAISNIKDTGSESPAISKSHRNKSPYKIISSRYVSRSSIRRNVGTTNGVRINLKQNGIDNTDIEDFSLAFNSGNEYRMGNTVGIENSSFPLYVKVTYRTWNTFHAVQNDVIYEFIIYYPGAWDVIICN
ncbi:MAG: hypothetical protein IPN67_02705 [Bacteroidales bacterium]|nr:hypothetical protein [Bacteroidales bacterium]